MSARGYSGTGGRMLVVVPVVSIGLDSTGRAKPLDRRSKTGSRNSSAGSAGGAWAANADVLARADVLVQELDLEALLLRLELDDVPDRDDAHNPALIVDDR
jgi:hypothetical protein